MSWEWGLTSAFGIQRDDKGNAWNAGRTTALLPMVNGDMLAGTPNGLWRISASGVVTRLNLAGWATEVGDPSKTLLAAGPDGPGHVFFLGVVSGLWVTDVNSNQPLDAPWIRIPSPDFGLIENLLVLPGSRRIVVTGNTGLWWAPIPVAGVGTYAWIQADPDPCCGLAEAAGGSVIVTKTGSGLFLGQ